jgi:hypothetical protein
MRKAFIYITILLHYSIVYSQIEDSTIGKYENYTVFKIDNHTYQLNSNETAKIFLYSHRDLDKSYQLDFSHIDCGEISYFLIQFTNGEEMFFERDITGENFIDSLVNYVSGFKLNRKQFQKYKNKEIAEFKFFASSFCSSANDFYYLIWNCEFYNFRLSDLKFEKYK